MKEVFIVTHAEATHHVDGLVGGWYDSELTTKGHHQARLIGEALEDRHRFFGAPVFASDLKRAAQTGEAIASILGAPLMLDSRLRELSYGVAEGKRKAWLDTRIKPIDPIYPENRLDHPVIEDGETKRELAVRLYMALEEIQEHDRAVICTHGYAATFLIAAWIGMPMEAVGRVRFHVDAASLTKLEQDDVFHNRSLVFLNQIVSD